MPAVPAAVSSADAVPSAPRLPVRLTSFVGRAAELAELGRLVGEHRLVTLTGAGGVGKTRLALRLAAESADRFPDHWWVDLAPTTDPDLVAERVAHTLGLADQPDRSVIDALVGFIGDRQLLLVLDNCEHLLDACAALATTLLAAGAGLRIIATSREPLRAPGELTWPTPPLSPADEGVELFTQRARLVRPDFAAGGDAAAVVEVCRHLHGSPLAIELAATRVRALSLTEIIDGLQHRLQLLTGGARTAAPRQQTLRASMDWSHDLLDEPERVMFRRLAVFVGCFDLDAAQPVAGEADAPRHRVVDELTQLVDKSLLVVDNTGSTTRYWMLETIRQYALEKLAGSGEADAVRSRHRDHYTTLFDSQGSTGYRWHIEHAETEIDNLRAAFGWSLQHGDVKAAAHLASALRPLWVHSRTLEGLAWFNAILTADTPMPASTRARVLADKTILETVVGDYFRIEQAEQAVAIARDLGDPALLAWALAACGFTCCYNPEIALPYFREALELAPALDDWRLSQIYGAQTFCAFVAGDLPTMCDAAAKGCALADAVDDWSARLICGFGFGVAHLLRGDPTRAAACADEMAAVAHAARDPLFSSRSLLLRAQALARRGDSGGARTAAQASVEAAADLIASHRGLSLGALVDPSLAAGDVPTALAASQALLDACPLPQLLAVSGNPVARAALASGDVITARRWADEAFSVGSGVHRILLLDVRARVAIAEGEVEQAERDARQALAIAVEAEAYLAVPDLIECLAVLAVDHRAAATLFGAAAGIRDRAGLVRYQIYDADHLLAVDTLREALGQRDFDRQWAEGAALSTTEAIARARASRTQGDGNRPASGWDALTPAERNVTRLVAEGLRSKDIAEKLSISARTVDSHLTRIYTKLGLSSRVQLAQEATRRG